MSEFKPINHADSEEENIVIKKQKGINLPLRD